MLKTRFIFVALICASPAILLWDGLIMQAIVAGLVAIVLGIIGQMLRPGETGFFIPLVRPLAVVAAVPALWMLIQALPLRIFANPIWMSAEQALAHPISSTISIDPGASIVALGQYLSMGAVALVSAAIAVDRQRAEWILFALVAASTAIALMVLVHDLFDPGLLVHALMRTQAIDCVGLGVILATAAYVRTIEREESHLNSQRAKPVLLRSSFAFSIAALAICVAALIFDGYWTLFAVGCGLAAFASVLVIRRFARGPWDAVFMATVPIIAVAFLLAYRPPLEGKTAPLALMAAPSASLTLSERVLEDAPLVGTGAGTFAAIAPIYREIDDPPPGPVAATTAMAFAIELGKPMFSLIAMATVVAIFVLLRATLRRGRDSFYPALAGSSLITIVLLAFTNAGLLGTATSLMAAAVLGLGFAQSRSRSARL